MARYIDAENTTELPWLREAFPLLENFYLIPKDTPAADARPERHGEWLVSGDCYECSECGGGSVVNTNPYCWKCGAKMDGKDSESDG